MEPEKVLRNFLDEGGRLKAWPAKRKLQLWAAYYLWTKLERGREYTESEMNDALDEWHVFHDPATLRRELYNLRLTDREPNGTRYRAADEAASPEM